MMCSSAKLICISLWSSAVLFPCTSAWTMNHRHLSVGDGVSVWNAARSAEHSCIQPEDQSTSVEVLSRRRALSSVVAATAGALSVLSASTSSSSNRALAADTEGLKVFQLPSGLKYIDLKEGTGPTPEYGQLCSIAYKGYIKLPASKENANPQPQLFGQSKAYLIKHGNGRTIPGLDEGVHTLKVGGTRRLIIPAKLGFIQSGLGPLPPSPWDRYRLNSLLNDMVRLQGGNLVFEVTLLSAIDDEADQGYYQDSSLSPEDFETLRINLQRKAQAAKDAAEQS